MMRLRMAAAVAFLATVPLFGQETYNKYHHGLPDERRPPNIPFRRGTVSVEPSQLYEEIPLAPTPVFILPHREMRPQKIAALSQVRIPGPGGAPPAVGGPTSSPSASNVGSISGTSTGTTIPGTTFAGTSGSLVFLTSKSQITGALTATVAFILSGATCSTSSLTTTANGVSSSFQEAAGWCLLSNTATVTPSVNWSGGGTGAFTDLTTTMFTSTSGFNASPLDQSIDNAFSATAGTSCASGNTSATTNANDLVVGVGFNFNQSQTPYNNGTTGYTSITAANRNTTTVQYKNVSTTGIQSFNLTFTNATPDIWACAVYAFKMI